MSEEEDLAREIFVAHECRRQDPHLAWHELGYEDKQYAYRLAETLIANGWTNRPTDAEG